MGPFRIWEPIPLSTGPGDLIINEIHYHPVEGENHEFIEMVNAGESSVNINGY